MCIRDRTSESRRGDAQSALTLAAQTTAAAGPAQSSNIKSATPDVTQKIKELVSLAREQGDVYKRQG